MASDEYASLTPRSGDRAGGGEPAGRKSASQGGIAAGGQVAWRIDKHRQIPDHQRTDRSVTI
jgi:hypothetical protein